MRYRFITIIHNLKLDETDCFIPLVSGIISNKIAILKDILNYESTLSLHTLGVHSIDEFQGKTFYVVDGEFGDDITMKVIDSFGTSMTFAFLRQIQWLTDGFWNKRDNSIYVRDGFLFVYDKEIEDGVTFKASLSTVMTKASTEIEAVTFSKEEILDLSKDMKVISMDALLPGNTSLNSLSEINPSEINYRDATQFQYFKSAKLGRKMTAWIYIFHARAVSALTIKVLMYITAMEALVSTSTAELSHQVAERVAILLGTDTMERISIYNEVKKGYGVRSKAAHGEPLKGTEQDVMVLLIHLDDYLRQMMKLDTPYDLEQNKLNDFFIKKLMGDTEE